MRKICCQGGTKVSVEGGNQKFCFDWGGGIPLDGYGPPINIPPDIRLPWSNSLLDSQSLGQVGVVIGVSDNVLLCSFFNCQ